MESLRAFMTQVFYGNSLQDWAIAFVILAGTLVVAKLVYWVLSRFLKRLFKRAESRLMELVVDMIEEPVVFSMIISGFWFGLNTLQLPSDRVGDRLAGRAPAGCAAE
jgi:MscS family membrane protein